jgi:hypothetical protein
MVAGFVLVWMVLLIVGLPAGLPKNPATHVVVCPPPLRGLNRHEYVCVSIHLLPANVTIQRRRGSAVRWNRWLAPRPLVPLPRLCEHFLASKPHSLLADIQRKQNLGIRVECIRLEFVVSHREMRPEHQPHFGIIMEVHELFV